MIYSALGGHRTGNATGRLPSNENARTPRCGREDELIRMLVPFVPPASFAYSLRVLLLPHGAE